MVCELVARAYLPYLRANRGGPYPREGINSPDLSVELLHRSVNEAVILCVGVQADGQSIVVPPGDEDR